MLFQMFITIIILLFYYSDRCYFKCLLLLLYYCFINQIDVISNVYYYYYITVLLIRVCECACSLRLFQTITCIKLTNSAFFCAGEYVNCKCALISQQRFKYTPFLLERLILS